MFLRNQLVQSYPFKMMDTPPYQFYENIGEMGAIIAPTVAIALILILKSAQKYWIPTIPVLACPLIFLLVFEYFSWVSPYHGAIMSQTQFEGCTGETARQLFVKTSLILAGVGLITGFVCGVIVSLAEDLLNKISKEAV